MLGSLYSCCMPLGNRGPIVSFSFDDFPRSAYATGGAILKNCGVRGTYYAAVGLMNTSNHLGEQFRREDLESLVEDGHELANHTFSHVSCRSLTRTKFIEEIEKGRKAIQEITGQTDCGNFAFPFGDITVSARRIVSRQVASSRSTWSGVNGPTVDLSLLRANSLYGTNAKAEQAKQLILSNEQSKSWLIFYSHDVRPNPSQFGCTPSLFESVVSFAVERGSHVMTIAQVLAELGLDAKSPLAKYKAAE